MSQPNAVDRYLSAPDRCKRVPGRADGAPWDEQAGRRILLLAGAWRTWMNRRVETITLMNESTTRRRVSVDFTIPPVLLRAESASSQDLAVPIATLNKQLLLNFDIRDEDGAAVPLLTRRVTAALTADALAELARLVAADRLNLPMPSVKVPADLWKLFYAIAYLPPERQIAERTPRECCEAVDATCARDLLLAIDPGGGPPAGTEWAKSGSKDVVVAWRRFLSHEPKDFGFFLDDRAESYLVLVPVDPADGEHRLLKFAYEAHRELGRPRRRHQDDQWWWKALDVLEGVYPAGVTDADWNWRQSDAEWRERRDTAVRQRTQPPEPRRRRATVATRFGRFLGWGTHRLRLDVPGVAQAQSYHVELEAPDGLQVRAAALLLSERGEVRDVRRGARTLARVHLQTWDVASAEPAVVDAQLKAESTTLLRAATFTAAVALLLLWWYFVKLETIVARPGEQVVAIAAILLLLPGVTTGIVVGGAEHPMTTTVLLHQRTTAVLVAVWPAFAAVLLATVSQTDALQIAWLVLLLAETLTLIALAGGWALAERRRPDGGVP